MSAISDFRATRSVAGDAIAGLMRAGQRSIPSKYLYDRVGSLLFEAITELPEYGATRADERLLLKSAQAAASLAAPRTLVIELGCGSGRKSREFLRRLLRQTAVRYSPIETSAVALEWCQRGLADLPIEVRPVQSEYLEGLDEALEHRRSGESVCVLFLGSSIGNFVNCADLEFLAEIHGRLRTADLTLISMDLDKPEECLRAAYDDPAGVTAAFNLNVLARMNREFGANFNLSKFRHTVVFKRYTRDIEMHLESTCDQVVHIPGVDPLRFRQFETIHTESSHKYTVDEVSALVCAAGFGIVAQWVDRQWPFAQTLLTVP